MSAERILVPIDFSSAADTAIDHAAAIAAKNNDKLTLLHVMGSKENENITRDKLHAYAERIRTEFGLESEIAGVHGHVIKEIEGATRKSNYRFMVLVTHGLKGLRQKLFGADALHIGKESVVPVIIVQEGCPPPDYSKIVFPYGGHEHYENKIEATLEIAKRFGSEVHIYSIDRPGEKPTDQAASNVEKAKKVFAESGISFVEIHEQPSVISLGFARQTLKYAESVNAGLIAIMSSHTHEFSHIAQADKETLINNKSGIAILLTGNKVKSQA